MSGSPTILHVPYTYLPDPIGGTEVYVSSLAAELERLGARCVIAAPGAAETRLVIDGLDVRRFATGAGEDLAYGAPDETAAAGFARLLDEVRPDVVHLHARSAAASELLFKAAKARGARTVFTYHTPTVSCARGTMRLFGASACDGALDAHRCTACVLAKHGVPAPVGAGVALLPRAVGRAAETIGLTRGPWLALRMRRLAEDDHARFHAFMALADRVVAVCGWVAEVLRRNGVVEPKLILNRQGLNAPATPAHDDESPASGPLRIAYFGRLDPTKGVDTLVAAVRELAADQVRLTIHGVAQDGSSDYSRRLSADAAGATHIAFRDPVPASAVVGEMGKADLVAVPSTWLETGPLVVLEAFAAGVPVLGSNLGGIAELVRDGVDGVLAPPGDVRAWRDAIAGLATDRARLARLRAGVRPPRTMETVARDMAHLYSDLIRTGEKAA